MLSLDCLPNELLLHIADYTDIFRIPDEQIHHSLLPECIVNEHRPLEAISSVNRRLRTVYLPILFSKVIFIGSKYQCICGLDPYHSEQLIRLFKSRPWVTEHIL
jgi:hypothetical protein